jgi:DNA end-binding protein Ku
VVIGRRERAVAILPSGRGMVCHTLHDPAEIWDAEPIWAGIGKAEPEESMITLAKQLIDRQNGTFKPDDTEDRYEAKLREVIAAKLKGEGIDLDQPIEPDRGNVVDLMAALKASLAEEDTAPAPKKRTRKHAS